MSQLPGGEDYSGLTYTLAGIRRRNPFDSKRAFAHGLLQQGMDASPVQHPLQGVSRLAQALVGGWMASKADEDERKASDDLAKKIAEAGSIADPTARIAAYSAIDPQIGMRAGAQMAVEQAKLAQQREGLQTAGSQLAAGYGMPSGPQVPTGAVGDRIANVIESGGRYDAVGPVANKQGHRAYGKYQVLEPNIGPWTQEVTGRAWTPQEFIADTPEAKAVQEAVFKAKFGQYRQKYGSDEAASRAWFAGEGRMNNPDASDVNGMTVARYQQLATGTPMVAQGGNPQAAPGMPPAPSPQGINAPAVIAPPAIPQRPTQPSPQILAQADALLRSGQFGRDPATAMPAARAWVEQQMGHEYEAAKLRFQQESDLYKNDRAQQQGAPQKLFENAGKLRDDFGKEPVVKAYRVVVPMLESAKDAATRPTRAADINLVYAFAKLMDPDSVVRESETGMVQASATVQDRLAGLIGHLNGNPMLQPETRAKLIAELQSRFNSLATSYKEIEDAYGGIADSGGIPRNHVILPIRKPGQGPQIEAPTSSAPKPGSGPAKLGANGEGYDQLPAGAQYIAPDGSLRTKGGK